MVKRARLTLRQLDSLRTHTSPTSVVASEAVARLRAAAHDIDDSIAVHIGTPGGAATPEDTAVPENAAVPEDAAVPGDVAAQSYPADAVRAIGAALAEALRNSIRHAGPSTRSITVEAGPGILSATVTDDGVGFDRTSVPPHRLGLTVSIRGRLRQLPGGSSRIDSTPGQGTSVQLMWRARDVPLTAVSV